MNWYKQNAKEKPKIDTFENTDRDWRDIGHSQTYWGVEDKKFERNKVVNYIWWLSNNIVKVIPLIGKNKNTTHQELGHENQWRGRAELTPTETIVSVNVPYNLRNREIPSFILRQLYRQFGEDAQIIKWADTNKNTKIAFPVVDTKTRGGYQGIGHDYSRYHDKNIILWAIDKKGQFYEHDAVGKDGNGTTHWELMENGIFPMDVMATGRYDSLSKTCSVIYFYNKDYHNMFGDTEGKKIELQERVVSILDNMLNNPKITVFASRKKYAGVYGYWVTPEGKMIPVKFQEHGAKLREIGFSGGYTEAFGKGWIRITSEYGLDIEIRKKPTSSQIRSVMRLYNDLFADALQRPIVFVDYMDQNLKANSYESLIFLLENGRQPRIFV